MIHPDNTATFFVGETDEPSLAIPELKHPVAPGLVVTQQTQRLVDNERQADASRSMHVLDRFGQPEDVASALAWLVDPANDWVTGQVLGVDGGLGHVRTRAKA